MTSIHRRVEERLATALGTGTVQRAVPIAAASAVYVAYLVTHPYPSYGAGLFLQTAEQIAANGYGLPDRIPGYTAGGIPFAYPPLAFYVLALLIDVAGVEPIAVARFLPGLVVIAYLLAYYGLAAELTASVREATLATVILATAPPVLQWHLSAGGVVRSTAFLFALTSIYAGLRLFRTHAPRWAVAAAGTFALVVLTHPTYAVFTVVSYLAAYVAIDRSLRGLAAGAAVGVGGLALAAPWWLHVVAVHGVDAFLAAGGTHGGLGAPPGEVWAQLTAPLDGGRVQWPFYAALGAGWGYAVLRRRWFLPAWLLVLAFVLDQNRFLFVPGSLLAAAFLCGAAVPAVRDRVPSTRSRRTVTVAMLGVVVLAAATAGTLYGAGAVASIRGDDRAQPQFVDAADEEAMTWAERHTRRDATFVVLGDAAEWFPFVADRTILIGPWGVEWKGTASYYEHYARFQTVSTCRDAACIARTLDDAGVNPDYVYVPTGRYTVRDKTHVRPPTMTASLRTTDTFRVAFENDGVVIAEVADGEPDAGG